MPSHGIAYDAWAGIVPPKIDDDGFAYMPEHVSIGINAGPVFGALGSARRRHPRPRDRRGLPARDRAVRRRRRHRLAAQRDVQGVRAAGVRGDRQRGRQLRAPRAGHRAAWKRACATSSTRPPTATCCSWPSSASSGRTSAKGVGRPELFEKWPGSQYGDHARGNTELRAILRDDLRRRARRRSGSRSAWSTTRRSRRRTRRRRSTTTRSSRTACRGSRPSSVGADMLPHADQVRRRGAARADEGADGRPAHRAGAARRARLGRRPHRRCRAAGAFGSTT